MTEERTFEQAQRELTLFLGEVPLGAEPSHRSSRSGPLPTSSTWDCGP